MTKHIHIHFSPRKHTQDQAPGSVPMSDVTALVAALHEALAARQASTSDREVISRFLRITQDADFDESKVKRSEGGQFSAQQHTTQAEHHNHAAAMLPHKSEQQQAHTDAAEAHTLAAQHITAQTGWATHNSNKAMQATQKALATSGPANLGTLKQQASDPKLPVEQRAQAVAQLDKMEKSANAVAASPHAVPEAFAHGAGNKPPAGMEGPGAGNAHPYAVNGDPKVKAPPAASSPLLKQMQDISTSSASPEHKKAAIEALQAASKPAPAAPVAPVKTAAALHGTGLSPEASERIANKLHTQPNTNLGVKPTSSKASGAKAATHELLSSGHPFSVDELMAATGASSKSTLMTALSDLKSAKYAGKLGALNIVKRPDGTYHVQKDSGAADPKAAEAAMPTSSSQPKDATAPGGTQIKPMPQQGLGYKPSITSPMGPGNPLAAAGPNPEADQGSSNMSSFFKQAYKKLGQNKATASSTKPSGPAPKPATQNQLAASQARIDAAKMQIEKAKIKGAGKSSGVLNDLALKLSKARTAHSALTEQGKTYGPAPTHPANP